MGRFNDAYREWLRLTPPNKTYNNLKLRFTKEYQIQNELDGTTAQGAGYNIEEVSNITGATPTSPTDNQVLTHLSDTNSALQHNMYNVMEQNNSLQQQLNELQQQMLMMTTAPAAPPVAPPPVLPPPVAYQTQTPIATPQPHAY